MSELAVLCWSSHETTAGNQTTEHATEQRPTLRGSGSTLRGSDRVMSLTYLRWGHVTNVGRVRKANQDSVWANGSLFVVADGMGGHQGGEVASSLTVGAMTSLRSVSTVDELRDAVVHANTMIRNKGANDSALGGMGTTVVAMGVLPAEPFDGALHLCAANVGDSRLYLFANGKLEQISVDHSLVGELQRAGQITADEAARHPQRNVVTRALGADDDVDVDTWVIPAVHGQRFLLCSDGLVNEVSDAEISLELASTEDPVLAAENLVAAANNSGGRDNITVLILDVLAELS